MNVPTNGRAYFLDIDGTLLELAATPYRVRPARGLRRLIETLYRSTDGAIALITGRPLGDIDRLFDFPRLPAAGQHGLERRRADGRVTRHARTSRALTSARDALSTVVAKHPGLLFEDKGLSLALHYRRAPRLAGFAHRLVRSLGAELGGQYEVQRGKRVVELVPAGRDKGVAIAAFMRERPFRGRTPVFIGDDVTDEYGFAMVNGLGGVTIKVGPGPTAAAWRLPDVRAVLGWLDRTHPLPPAATPGIRR